MKTFTFKLFGHTFTINLGRKKKEPKEEIKMEVKNYLCFFNCCHSYIQSQEGTLSEATLKGYKNICNNHLDSLMSCYMDKLDESVIQQAFDEEIEKGLSEKTLKGYRTFVLKVLAKYKPEFKPEIRVKSLEVKE